MKKFFVSILMSILFFSILSPSQSVSAISDLDQIPTSEIEAITGGTLVGYNYIEYGEPILTTYDGVTERLLGYFEPVEQDRFIPIEPQPVYEDFITYQPMDYREYTRWYVYDQGITKSWSYLSNPYFIKSIARGMTYEKTQEVSATISGSISSDFPSASLSSVKSSFGLSSSGTKKVTVKVTLSGPGNGYSSRDFYYKKGRHTHSVKVVEERRSNWDGVLWKKTYKGTVGKPAIKHYSVDRK